MPRLGTVPLARPTEAIASADAVVSGAMIPPLDRIRIFSPQQWEAFILEWADSLEQEYVTVAKCGGAGDMGRDVVAEIDQQNEVWDNYQCKHYKDPLVPTDVWVELGKLIHYSRLGFYTYPRKYYFIAPQGAGNTLSRLLKKPEQLRAGLLANWDKHCRKRITSEAEVDLTEDLKQYIDGLDFSIFSAIPPLRIIDEHARTRWYVFRFGGGLPERPEPPAPPEEPTESETVFVRELLSAYGERVQQQLTCPADLQDHPDMREHLGDARREFYSAESLRTFSRDTLPPGEFERLQNEIHHGVKDDVRAEHPDGFARVLAVVKTARVLPLDGHPLRSRMGTMDRGGVCHQLANDGKVKWVK
jgi:hypothetical protein